MRVLICILVGVLLVGGLAADSARAQEAPTYTVKRGDTLYSIARRYGLTVEALQQLNNLEGTTIHPGQELIVRSEPESAPPEAEDKPDPPVPDPPPPDTALAQAPPDSAAVDTAQALAGPPPPDTTQAQAEPPPPDTALTLTEPPPPPARPAEPSAGALRYDAHEVKPGATLYGIAARYGISADTLRALNEDLPTFLEAGQTLKLPRSLSILTHRVAEGETIYDVAARYGVSVMMLQRANGLETRDLTPGRLLRIPGRRKPEPEPRGTLPPVEARGPVQRYPDAFAGRLTASGAVHDPEAFTVSHPALPFGTVVLLTNPDTGRSAFARVADRGPLDEAYVMDVSAAVARQLGLEPESRQSIEVRVMK